MSNFFSTNRGVKFVEGTLPELVRQLTRLNDNLEALRTKPERNHYVSPAFIDEVRTRFLEALKQKASGN